MASQLMGVAGLNMGMGGSYWVENGIADYLASRQGWGFATFEFGVNMLQAKPDNATFTAKVDYFLKTISTAHPDKPIGLITFFRSGLRYPIEKTGWTEDLEEKNDRVRVIFHGPHSFISPSYYVSEGNVPTWNYTAVSMTGRAEIVEDPDSQTTLIQQLIATHERSRPTPWELDTENPKMMMMFKAIVCFPGSAALRGTVTDHVVYDFTDEAA